MAPSRAPTEKDWAAAAVKVRAVFQKKVLDNLGGIMGVQQVQDPEFYQTFFSKVDKGIFIEKQNL